MQDQDVKAIEVSLHGLFDVLSVGEKVQVEGQNPLLREFEMAPGAIERL